MDLYSIFRFLFYIVLRIYFSELEILGAENIPKEGAVVFVGNHQNQFVDPLLILCHCKRKLGFLTAAKSMDRPMVGFFARALNSIPVTRPQDIATQGTGTVIIEGKKVTGTGTKFLTELEKGKSITVHGMEDPVRVEDVKSDTECLLASAAEYPNAMKFKIVPKLDHSAVYQKVWQELGNGGCIGIFPEGGSHDRTQLLPLKAGVTLMALGAMDKYKVPVTVVPVGLNYFSGHRFRSHVVVEFGKPYEIPHAFSDDYKTNKRDACQNLLGEIDTRLHSVTLNAPDFRTLSHVHLIRRLYQPTNKTLTADQYMELNRRFSVGYVKFKDNPQLKPLVDRVTAYHDKLHMFGIKDYHVASPEGLTSTVNFLCLLIARGLLLLIMFAAALPGVLFNSPIGVIAKVFAVQQAKKAKASSIVKVHGHDVISSYKLLIGAVITPVLYWFYALLVAYYWSIGAGLLFLLVWPIFSYASVKVAEEGVHMAKSLLTLFKVRWAATELDNLREERKALTGLVRKVVEEFGPKLGPEIWDHRIVSEEELKQEEDTNDVDAVAGVSPFLNRSAWKNRSYARKDNSLEKQFKTLDDADDFLDDIFK